MYDQRVGRDERAVALMQPTFLPWAGYFALADAADVFVFLDDFQFQRRSWHHRNRMFSSPGEATWVTVPVTSGSKDGRPAIDEVTPIVDADFRKTFRGLLQHGYGRSEHLEALLPALDGWIERDWANLADFNIAFIELAFELLGIRTETRRSSEVGSEGRRSARLADLLGRLEATRYLSAAGSREYMVEDGVFPLAGVETSFQDYEPVAYPQQGASEFVSSLSVLDLLLQVGPERAGAVIREGSRPFRPWED